MEVPVRRVIAGRLRVMLSRTLEIWLEHAIYPRIGGYGPWRYYHVATGKPDRAAWTLWSDAKAEYRLDRPWRLVCGT